MDQSERSVLLIDASPQSQALYCLHLQNDSRCSYSIVKAFSGRQGLASWKRHQPDITLLICPLPDLSGLEFLAELRALLYQSFLPVVVVAEQQNEMTTSQALGAGAQDYVLKAELTPELLYRLIDGAISTIQLQLQQQQHTERERLILRITQSIHQTLNSKEVLQTTVAQVRAFLQADRILLLQMQADGHGDVVAESASKHWPSIMATTYLDSYLSEEYIEHFRQGQIRLKSDAQDGSLTLCHAEFLERLQVQSYLIIPVLQRGTLWGLLVAHQCSAPRVWRPQDVDLLREIATQVGIALQQAELYQRSQLELAERKRIAAQLEESEAHLQLVLQGAEAGLWIWNIATGEDYFSPRWLEMLGYAAEELPENYRSWEQLIHPDDKPWIMKRLNAHLRDAAVPYKFEYRLRTKSGEWKWIANYGKVVVRNAQGKPLCMAGIHHDITERKQNELALRQSEDRFRLAIKSTQLGTWDWSLLTNELVWDARCREIFGLLPGAKVSFEVFFERVHPDDRDRLNQVLQWSFDAANDGSYDVEYRIVRLQDRAERWIKASGQAYFSSTKEPQRFIGIVMDITSQKQAEQVLVERAEGLDQRNGDLQQFAYAVSHDLKAPLRGIRNLSGWLQEDLETSTAPDTQKHLHLLTERVSWMEALINGLLSYSCTGQANFPIEKVDVGELVEEIIASLLLPSGIKIHILTPLPILQTGRLILRQVFANLIDNAVKYGCPSQKGEITISVRQCRNNYYEFTVSDSGPGVDPSHHEKIFGLFETLRVKSAGNSGIGLTLVKRLVEAEGGVVRVESDIGQGAAFHFTWPCQG